MRIESQQFYLRRPIEEDLEHLLKIESDTEVVRFTPMLSGLPREKIVERHKKRLADRESMEPFGHWFAFRKSDDSFVGCFVIFELRNPHPEIGFMIAKEHWGKGYTTEISQALIDYGKQELKVEKFCAMTDLENVGSIRVLEKLGFKLIKKVQENEKELNYFELD